MKTLIAMLSLGLLALLCFPVEDAVASDWVKVMTSKENTATANVDQASIKKQSGNIYSFHARFEFDPPNRNVSRISAHYEADCDNEKIRAVSFTLYFAGGYSAIGEKGWHRASPETLEDAIFSFVCEDSRT